MHEFDVYAYGVIAASELHLLSMLFPSPDAYAEIAESHGMTGGEALNSAIVLSRLGVKVQLDGNWIGATAVGERLLATIGRYGIDTQRLHVEPGFAGVREIVFSDAQSRTIFGNYVDLLSTTRKWNIPQKVDLAKARIVCVDPPFASESAMVGTYAEELGIPFVSIDCPYDQALSSAAAVVIISGEFRKRAYPQIALAELFAAYQQRAQGLVVFTVGDDAVWYARRESPIKQFKPYPVKVIDSAGAGDSFRAGVIYGMLQQWDDDQTIQYAAALAGLVCASFPGVLNSPTHAEVMQFIQSHQRTPS
ncbi:MAG: carbohydrate kinase family protein [Oscillochloridaceae bacterium umkhey_bin13]